MDTMQSANDHVVDIAKPNSDEMRAGPHKESAYPEGASSPQW